MLPLSLIFIPIVLWLVIGSLNVSEGFQDINPIISLVENLKQLSANLMKPELWKERIALIGKDPVTLARMEIMKEKTKS